MVDILDEAREAVQQERMLSLLKKYGAMIILGTVVVVIAIIGQQMWKAHQIKAALETSNQYFDALEQLQAGNQGAAETTLKSIIENGSGGYKTLAALQLAAEKTLAGKKDEAIALYTDVEKNGADKALRELGGLLAAQHKNEKVENTTGVWKFTALEMQGLQQLQAKEYAKARESFTMISMDPATPQNLRQRAADYLLYTSYLEAQK